MKRMLVALMFLLASSSSVLIGCTPRRVPFTTVEVCFEDAGGATAFKQEMRAIAQARHLSVIDDSTRAESEVDRIASQEFLDKLGRPVVSMIIKRDDKVIAMIGTIGLPSGQAVISFFDNSEFDSHKFADDVIERLEATWRIELVPAGQGAQGIEACR